MAHLTIHSRSSWNPESRGCRPPRQDPSEVHELFIHWPGGLPGTWQYVNTVAEEHAAIRGIQHSHIHDNDWCDIGYTGVLCPNWGRPSRVPNLYWARGGKWLPAGQLGHNFGTWAFLVLMGPNDPLTDDVKARLRSLVREVRRLTGNDVAVRGHREVVATECPGPKLSAYLPVLRRV